MSKRNKIALMIGLGTWVATGVYITALLPRTNKELLNAGRGMIGFVVGEIVADVVFDIFRDNGMRKEESNGRSEVTTDEQQSGEADGTNESETA